MTNATVRRRPRPAAPPPPSWRRFVPTWKQVLVGIVGAIVLIGIFLVIGYETTMIPDPSKLAVAQSTLVYDSDGHTLIGRLGDVNRIDVNLDQVPLPVQRTVLAAEDRHYYSEPGISVTGMLRALKVDVTGGSVSQGGSTITQQYAKNAFLSQARTFSRKIREIFLAVKLDHTQSKNTVLQNYLNTIYFGRGAYGIEAASLAYFGVGVNRLDVAQGAVLAGLINAPALADPYVNAADAQARWHYVINGMVTMKWLSPGQAAALHYPHVLAPRPLQTATGPNGFILDEVSRELAADGFSQAKLAAGGYRVYTTIDAKDQHAAVVAEDQLHSQVHGPVSSMVSLVPGNGAIRAWYGGPVYHNVKAAGSFIDLARNAREQAGSSFKPYTMITALEQGIGLNTTFNGSSPQTLPGYGVLKNSNNEQCNPCSLTTALYRSINTVFVPLAARVGPANVRKTARASGVNEPLLGASGQPESGIGIGIYPVNALDQATGFATIAAQGMAATPYMVAKVGMSTGQVVYQMHPKLHRVYSAAIASDAIYPMEQVLTNPAGTAYGKSLAGGRPAAGKTGTATNRLNQNNEDWFVGFTPQLSTAVWLGNLNNAPVYDKYGNVVYGGGIPAAAWQTYMNAALAGAPVQQFPPPAPLRGKSQLPFSPKPSPTPKATPTPTPKRSPSPKPSPVVTHTPPPSTTSAPPPPSPTTPPPTTPPPPTTLPPTPGTAQSTGATTKPGG